MASRIPSIPNRPIPLAILQVEFFTDTNSIGTRARSSFVTSFPDKAPLYQEPELPVPMLVLVATAVCTLFKSSAIESQLMSFVQVFAAIDQFNKRQRRSRQTTSLRIHLSIATIGIWLDLKALNRRAPSLTMP